MSITTNIGDGAFASQTFFASETRKVTLIKKPKRK